MAGSLLALLLVAAVVLGLAVQIGKSICTSEKWTSDRPAQTLHLELEQIHRIKPSVMPVDSLRLVPSVDDGYRLNIFMRSSTAWQQHHLPGFEVLC